MGKTREQMALEMLNRVGDWERESLVEFVRDRLEEDFKKMTQRVMEATYEDFLEYHPEYGEEE